MLLVSVEIPHKRYNVKALILHLLSSAGTYFILVADYLAPLMELLETEQESFRILGIGVGLFLIILVLINVNTIIVFTILGVLSIALPILPSPTYIKCKICLRRNYVTSDRSSQHDDVLLYIKQE